MSGGARQYPGNWLRAALVLVCLVGTGTSCVVPAPDYAAYQSKAVSSAETGVSGARSAILVSEVAGQDGAPETTVRVSMEDAEVTAITARDTFASIQPPDIASDQLRATLLPDLQRASDLIGEMRIAVRRDDLVAMQHGAAQLDEVAAELERFIDDQR